MRAAFGGAVEIVAIHALAGDFAHRGAGRHQVVRSNEAGGMIDGCWYACDLYLAASVNRR